MKYCYHCMNEMEDNDAVCKHCGKEQKYNVVPAHILTSGTKLGDRYLLGGILGEGGFGITYIGLDTVLKYRVAIKEFFPNGMVSRNCTASNEVKTVHSEESHDCFYKWRENFLQEAQTLARYTDEPGIVSVRDFFAANNTVYIVMEYLDGINLKQYLLSQGGKLPWHDAVKLLMPVLRALKRIHSDKMIHRDISPDNIMLVDGGKVKLLDFGSARGFDDRSLSVMLKHGYAPFEQYMRHGEQGAWTDIYAFCATLYKCVTGEAPLCATDRVDQDNMKMPSELGIRVSPLFEDVLRRGLAVRKSERIQTDDELMELLEKALEDDSEQTVGAYGGDLVPEISRPAAAPPPFTPSEYIPQESVSRAPVYETAPQRGGNSGSSGWTQSDSRTSWFAPDSAADWVSPDSTRWEKTTYTTWQTITGSDEQKPAAKPKLSISRRTVALICALVVVFGLGIAVSSLNNRKEPSPPPQEPVTTAAVSAPEQAAVTETSPGIVTEPVTEPVTETTAETVTTTTAATTTTAPKTTTTVTTTTAVKEIPKGNKLYGGSIDDWNWQIYDSGLLEITGSGAMTSYSREHKPPYYVYKDSITSIVIEEGIEKIGSCAFSDCSNVLSASVPKSATVIDWAAFKNCNKLEKITLPEIRVIKEDAFSGCTSLKVVEMKTIKSSDENKAFDVSINAFEGTLWLDEMRRIHKFVSVNNLLIDGKYFNTDGAEVKIPEGITTIAHGAFMGCDKIKSVTMPESLEIIKPGAFKGCTKLEKVTFSGRLREINSEAFYNCTSLKSAELPDSLMSIGASAFYNCVSLKNVTVPAGVTRIAGKALGYWYSQSKKTEFIDSGFTMKCYADSVAVLYATGRLDADGKPIEGKEAKSLIRYEIIKK